MVKIYFYTLNQAARPLLVQYPLKALNGLGLPASRSPPHRGHQTQRRSTSGHSIHLLNHPSILSIHLSIYSDSHSFMFTFISRIVYSFSLSHLSLSLSYSFSPICFSQFFPYHSSKYNFHQQTSIPPAAQKFPAHISFNALLSMLLSLPFFIFSAPIVNGSAITNRPYAQHIIWKKTVHII